MQFTVSGHLTIDVPVSNVVDLLKALRKGDGDAIEDAINVVDFDFDVNFG